MQYDTYGDVNGGGGNWPGSQRVPSPVEVLIGILGGGMGRRGGGMGGPIGGRSSGSNRADYALAGRYINEIYERTGARHHQADTISNLSYAFANIAEELRRQYSLGYYPKQPPKAGERRQVKVRVNQPNLAVRTRDSYIFTPTSTDTQQANQRNPPVLRKS